ncbi:YqaJ viral recombinase family protein [Nocardia transvalensis]|uniref:YqaJ viral recombinase family protein n=1 Tax=Nocardia transvalensis TaxID=37333 RepID=UPI001893B797|nr:YqaJ viral recombinase family protein [Nocardia transvalensis]MBF6332308.1 hypothetical protein [Nocardia transvalensis]
MNTDKGTHPDGDDAANTGALAVGSPRWRRTATASKVAAMLGVSPWNSPKAQWLKMRYPEKFPQTSNPVQKRGHYFESGFLRMWFDRNRQFRRIADTAVTYTRNDLGFPAAATPDSEGMIADTGQRFGIDVKTVGYWSDPEGLKWGDPGTDAVPDDVLVQVTWQMLVSGLRRTAVIKGGPCLDDVTAYWVDYDDAFATDMVTRVAAFMQSLDDDVEPDNDDRAETYEAIRTAHNDFDADEPDWPTDLDLAIEHIEAQLAYDASKARLYRVKSDLLCSMGSARRAIVQTPPGIDGNGRERTPKPLVVATRQPAGQATKLVRPRTDLVQLLATLRDLRARQEGAAA